MRGFLLAGALVGALAAPAAGCSSSDDTAPPAPSTGTDSLTGQTFVLVHGAWMGAWSWDDVRAGLGARGAAVEAVELPAHGDDGSPAAAVTLDAYVQTVAAAMDRAGGPVVLVGHSMAGVVLTAVAEQRPASVASLVYLAAYVPADGQSLQDLGNTDADSLVGPVIAVDTAALTASIPADRLADVFCADCDAARLATLRARYRDEPVVPLGTPVRTTAAGWGSVKKFYLYTEQGRAVSPALQRRMTEGIAWAATRTLPTSHAPFLSAPEGVVEALAAFAGAR
jgi:pimeloyl-ACP methyl ester carboxylesterase